MLEQLVAREIDYLWSGLARAARNLEAVAPLWSRGSDPRVVRLVESAAYVFGRVKAKLEDDLPEISHALMASALPEVLRPIPSATIVRVGDVRRERRDGVEHTTLELQSRPIDEAPCLFRTIWRVLAAPVAIERTTLRMPEPGLQTLTLRIAGYGGAALDRIFPNPLRVFVEASNVFRALDLVHAVCTSRSPIRVRAFGAGGAALGDALLPPTALRWTALEGPFRLFPGAADRFASGTALRAFHAFPELFSFFDLVGIGEALGRSAPNAEAVEITIRLGEIVGDQTVSCALDCAPAVNVFDAVATLPVPRLGNLGPIRAVGRPEAELFDIRSVHLQTARERTENVAVKVWERELGSEVWDDDLYLTLERRPAVDGGCTEILASLVRPDGREDETKGDLHVSFLATDGRRTEALLHGDVGARGDTGAIANITRVTPPYAPRFDTRLPWRMNAYARMPVLHFAKAGALASYVELFDPRRDASHAKHSDPALAGIVSATRRSVYRVVRDEVVHGDEVDLVLDEAAFGGRGATWVLGELVARAIAERADHLRFARTRWIDSDGRTIVDYGKRAGERLPPPFG